MRLAELTGPELIFPGLEGRDGPSVLRVLAEELARRGVVASPAALLERLLEREQLGSTGLGGGVAIPHCKMKGLGRVVLAIGILERGVDFAAEDGQPVRLFFLVISPEKAPAAHLQCLAAISRWVQADRYAERILELGNADEVYRLLQEQP